MVENQKQKVKNKNEQRSEEIKSDFITIASHQLRTPISGIRWSLDTLLNNKAGKLSTKQREVVTEAYQNNKFLAKAVNDLLRASRIEEGGLQLVVEKINLVEMVRGIIKYNAAFAKAYNCKIQFNPEKDIPSVYSDSLQLKPIIEGLLDNAIRYSKVSRGKGEIEIVIKAQGKFVLLTITDNGIGIPADQQHLVFDRFFRGRNAMKAQTEGLGLNLYIAKKILERLKAKISFTSLEGKGATFYITLPTTRPARPQSSVVPAPRLRPADPAQALKKEREFVAITIHELKAPLGMTKWSLEMLKKGKIGQLNSEQLELVSQVYRGNERLLVLVRDLLDLAKLQEGRFDVAASPIDLKTIIDDMIATFRNPAKQKNIILEMPTWRGRWPNVLGDVNRIGQVITNLLSNAIKYTPTKGTVKVEVKKMNSRELRKISQTTPTADITNINNKPGYLVISVTDNGMGISESDQKKLFSRFFRSSSVLQSKTEGTGLGLYITKTIVNLHHGDIWFESHLGVGSTFYFSLPIT